MTEFNGAIQRIRDFLHGPEIPAISASRLLEEVCLPALEEAHALQEKNERLKASRDYDQDMTAAMALDMSSIVEGKIERLHATEELLAEVKAQVDRYERMLSWMFDYEPQIVDEARERFPDQAAHNDDSARMTDD